MKFFPNMYKKSIFDINYQKLKKLGIKTLIFDLDNTIALINQKELPNDTKKLLLNLKKDFQVVIISNNKKKRVSLVADSIKCDYIYLACKPLSRGFRKIKRRYKLKNKEMAMIGDQLLTDIYGANRYKMFTILVDPLGIKDLKITDLNRLIEKLIFKKYENKNIMKKGVYYD